MSEFIGGRIVPKHCGVWDSTKTYEALSIVLEEDTGDSYISRKAVPAGTGLSQTEYWALCARFSEQAEQLREETEASVAEMEERTSAAENLANSNKAEMEKRMDAIEARQDANVSASTDSDADYAAEVVDSRVGWDSTAYASLGAAVRGQIGKSLKLLESVDRQGSTLDLDDVEVNTVLQVSSGSGETTMQNLPYDGSGFVITAGSDGGFTHQIFFAEKGYAFIRPRLSSGTWKDWVELDRDALCLTYEGVMSKDVSTIDLDDLDSNTCYVLSSGGASGSGETTVLNYPEGYTKNGLLVTLGKDGGARQQIIFGNTSKDIYTRSYYSGEWHGWFNYLDEFLDDDTSYLKRTGYVNRNTSTANLDDIEVNTILQVSSGSGETAMENLPYDGSGVIITIGAEGGFTHQIFLAEKGFAYIRPRLSSGIWKDWAGITDSSNDLSSYRGTNPNARMLSFGNSILAGSVWTEEAGGYDHLSAYHNAPYGCVAQAIGIEKSNVDFTLISSTGFLVDAGSGSFLENIMSEDIGEYDVVLTQIHTSDMNRYQIGTADAEAGDGTIAGGAAELLEYMKKTNPRCQLILASVAPVSTKIYGDEVFSGIYPNGSSISDLDIMMYELASKYHFIYVDWQDLNLSYYYRELCDLINGTTLNDHANSEDTYRVMGGYLGGRASAKLRF